jgi:type VI secretion system protein ImpA
MLIAPELDERYLAPLPGPRPAGEDLRYSDLWAEIREARRHEEPQDLGVWTHEPKEADWRRVFSLCSSALAERSKDLQVAVWRLEAAIRLDGFVGLRDGLALIRELIARYWDSGLHPGADEPDDWELRLGVLEWLNERLAQAVRQIVLAKNPNTQKELCYFHYLEALSIGSENDWRRVSGVDEVKKARYETAVADGRVSMDTWTATMHLAGSDHLSLIRRLTEASRAELDAIESSVCEKAGGEGISLSRSRVAIDEIGKAIANFVPPSLREASMDRTPTRANSAEPTPAQSTTSNTTLLSRVGSESVDAADPWARAEDLIRSGSIREGVSAMARLAASAPCGRDVFIRKLSFAESCLTRSLDRLAVLIFEELAEQIETFRLEQWESSALVVRVWGGLYSCYKLSAPQGVDSDKATRVYARFCRLNPWQVYCAEDGPPSKKNGDDQV